MEDTAGIELILFLIMAFCFGPMILGITIILIYTGVQFIAFIGEKFNEFSRKKK